MHSCLQFAHALCLVAFGDALTGDLMETNSNNEQPKFVLSAELREEWNDFKSKYSNSFDLWSKYKQYKDADEEQRRFKIFAAKMAEVKAHNLLYDQGLSSYQRGMNNFSDLTRSEIVKAMARHRRKDLFETVRITKKHLRRKGFKPTNAVDWRKEGWVTPVKDQTGTLEGQHFRKTGKRVSLSEQQLVDCAVEDEGCKCFDPIVAVDYIVRNGGIDTEASYPYEAKRGACRFNNFTVGATCKGAVWIPPNEKSLMEAVTAFGPIAVVIDAEHESFENYTHGVYYEPQCDKLNPNHAALVVGYGVTKSSKEKYWIVKNNWGTKWGEDGYIRMVKDKNNQCGIASEAFYTEV